MTPAPRPDLLLPLSIAALMLGGTLMLLVLSQTRFAVGVLVLSLLVLIAVVRDLIIGDR